MSLPEFSSGSTPRSGIPLPELLAPAGDWDSARAAVENGADAIYFGLEKFNARMRARNFTEADLLPLMQFLHRRGVRGYVTFNTLVFQDELQEAERHLRAIIAAGVDAVIVQDIGICRLIRALSPDFPIHASTQMTITSAAGVEFARDLGCHLVVLARENSLRDIERIQSAWSEKQSSARGHSTSGPNEARGDGSPGQDHSPLPLEVFVHGALCIAYSGQCLTSEALGGRSANRGECAQACRMPYELICDARVVPLADRRYLLSPQDLAGIDVLPQLVRAGVASLKIEGRLKTPEYVANITRAYRQALIQIAESDSRVPRVHGASSRGPIGSLGGGLGNPRYDMEMAFSRGLYTGWLRGINNQELVHARFGKKRGVYLGEVLRVLGHRVLVDLRGPLKRGDGVAFDTGRPDQEEQGGRVYDVREQKPRGRDQNGRGPIRAEFSLSFGLGDIDLSRIRPGTKLWKTNDPALDRRLRRSFEGNQPKFRSSVNFSVHGHAGQPLTLIARDALGHSVCFNSTVPLSAAAQQPLSTERLREQLGRLGRSPFELGNVENGLDGAVILPVSELNRLRREAIAELERRRTQPKRWVLRSPQIQVPIPALNRDRLSVTRCVRVPELIVLVRSLSQLRSAVQCGVATLYCDFDDPKAYREAVRLVRDRSDLGPATAGQSSITNRCCVFVAPPRVFKPGEEWILEQVLSCEADGYLVRNYDHLRFFSGRRRIGDFSLNVANAVTADYFKNTVGLERVTASYDLNVTQLEALLEKVPPDWLEVTIHQHMPMFHMEYCVFCAFLSKGTDYTNCGRPCDKHDVRLRDRAGAEHILRADSGCRNTLFNAVAQTGAEHVKHLLTKHLQHFRIEFVNETADQVTTVITKYRQLLNGEITGAQLWRELKTLNQLGVTRGTLERR